MTARHGQRTAGALLALAVLSGATACGGDEDGATTDSLSAQRAAEKAAVAAAEASMTYNFATLDADFDWVDDLATEEFREQFAEVSVPVRAAVEQGEVDARATVLESATDYEGASKVTVLLFVDQTIRSGKEPDTPASLEQHRVKMEMVREGDDWLVDGVEVVNRTTG